MPGTIQVSVLDFKGHQSSSPPPSPMSLKVSLGKREYQTWDKGDFSFPVTTLRNNLVVTLQDAEGNEISHAGVETRLVIEKGFWDDIFHLEGGGQVHMKLQFILSEEDQIRIRKTRESALKKKHDKLLNSSARDAKIATAVASLNPEVSDPRRLLRIQVANIKDVATQDNLATKPLSSKDIEGAHSNQKQISPNDTERREETSWSAPVSVGVDAHLNEVGHRDLGEKTEVLMSSGDVPVRDICSEETSSSQGCSESAIVGNTESIPLKSEEDRAHDPEKHSALDKTEENHKDLVEKTETDGDVPVRDIYSEETLPSLGHSESAIIGNTESIPLKSEEDRARELEKHSTLDKTEASHKDLVDKTEVVLTAGDVSVGDICSEETSPSLGCAESAIAAKTESIPLKSEEDEAHDPEKHSAQNKIQASQKDLVNKTEVLLTAGDVPIRDIYSEEASSLLGYSESAVSANRKSVLEKPEDGGANDPKKQNPVEKTPSNVRKVISAFEGSLAQQEKSPNVRPPPTRPQSSRIGVEAPFASPHLEETKTGKSKPAQPILGRVVNPFLTGKPQQTPTYIRESGEQIGSIRSLDGAKLTQIQSAERNPSLKNKFKVLNEEVDSKVEHVAGHQASNLSTNKLDSGKDKRSPESLMSRKEKATVSGRMPHEQVIGHKASNFSTDKQDPQESRRADPKDLRDFDIGRVSNDKLKSASYEEGNQYLESSGAWIFPDEVKHLCITTGGKRVMDLMVGCPTEVNIDHGKTGLPVPEKAEENSMQSGSDSKVNKGEKTSRKQRKPNLDNSADDETSNGPVKQAIKVAIMVGFGILVLFTRQRKNR